MNRRTFIRKTAAALLVSYLPGVPLAAQSETGWHAFAQPELIRIFGDRGEVAAVGRAYRRRFPQHNTPASLLAAWQPSAPLSLARQVHIDFVDGQTVQLNGWVLSLTEARQCALFSFLYS